MDTLTHGGGSTPAGLFNRFTGTRRHAARTFIALVALAVALPFQTAAQTTPFEVDKIPHLPGAYNPASSFYGTACDVLACGGIGNGQKDGQPISIVVTRWTYPDAPELKPYQNAGFNLGNNCTTNNSSCPHIGGYFPTMLAKRWSCPVGYSPSPTNSLKCRRIDIDPGKNNECELTTGPCVAGNPINVFTGVKVQREVDFNGGATKLIFERSYTSAKTNVEAGSTLGLEWRHSYMRSVRANLANVGGTVALSRPSGNTYFFSRAANGEWAPEGDVRYRLEELRSADALAGWRVHTPEDLVEVFDANGLLARIEYTDGDLLTLSYVGGQLTRVSDASGRSLTFTYSMGSLKTVTLPDATVLSYDFDSSGRLVRVVNAGHESIAYHYENEKFASALTGISDETGARYATWEYDDAGRAVRSYHGPHLSPVEDTRVAFDSAGATVIGALGTTSSYGKTVYLGRAKLASVSVECQGCGAVSGIRSQTYDPSGFPDIRVGFDGATTDQGFNERGLLTSESVSASGLVLKGTRTSWHQVWRVPVLQERLDASGSVRFKTERTINGRGQTLTLTNSGANMPTVRRVLSTYCEQSDIDAGVCPRVGLLLANDGPATGVDDTTRYTYYPADAADCASSPTTCVYRKGDLWKVTNALGQTTETLRYDGAGRVLSVRDANGVVTDFEYHPRGWLTARKVRGGDNASEADDLMTRIDYEPTGLVKQTTLPDGSYTEFTYDAAHRLTDITDAAGNRIHYTLDNAGNRTKEETFGANGAVVRTLSRVYNQLGQLKTSLDAYQSGTGYAYDANGNTDQVTDALGRVSDNDYDPLNRLTKTIQDVGGINAKTEFKYDALDNLTAVVDPKGLTTGYAYNGLGDLLKLTSPDTGMTTYTYDSAGNRASQTDARGVTTTYGYDALNRLTSVVYPTTSMNVTYTYDVTQAVCTSGEIYAVGRLTHMKDHSGATQYCYDRFGRMVRKVQTTNSRVFVLRYAYTKGGQISAVSYPDGTVADYVRDTLGRVTEVGVSRPGQPREVLLTNATHHAFGPVASWTYGNGRKMFRALDQNYAPGVIQDSAGDLSLGYEFDPVGNLSTLRDGLLSDPPKARYGYDALNRLAEVKDGATGTAIDTYGYDATGNRSSVTRAGVTTAYTYPSTSHRLTKVGAISRGYNAAGSTTSIGGTAKQFTYYNPGRVGQVKVNGAVTMNYVYNGKGEQVRRYTGTINTFTMYDEAGQWLGEYHNDRTPVQQVIWLDSLPVGVISAGKLHYVESDHLGTPRVIVDPQRDVAVWKWELTGEAFGETPPKEDVDGDGQAFVFNLRFPGQRYDVASGLNYNYFRDYEPGTGRYVQSDPIGLMAGVSTYGYVSGSPLVWADMYGLLQWTTNPIVWSQTLVPGLQTRTFPGDGVSTVTGSSLARTTLDWSISPACACSSGGFSLNEYTVGFTPIVFLRQSYSDAGQRRDTRRAELDHVRDFGGWINGGARTAAQALEDSMKGQSFSSMAECESAARQAMQQLLQSGARQTAIDSHNRWDVSGRHTQVVPGP
jgi:RHS repeat-associated protein